MLNNHPEMKVNVTDQGDIITKTSSKSSKNGASKLQKYISSFECDNLKLTVNYVTRKTHPNLPNENHTTQIELDQSKAFMVQSKQMVNNVFQVEKVTMTTVLEHQRYSVGKYFCYFLLFFESLGWLYEIDIFVTIFCLELCLKFCKLLNQIFWSIISQTFKKFQFTGSSQYRL